MLVASVIAPLSVVVDQIQLTLLCNSLDAFGHSNMALSVPLPEDQPERAARADGKYEFLIQPFPTAVGGHGCGSAFLLLRATTSYPSRSAPIFCVALSDNVMTCFTAMMQQSPKALICNVKSVMLNRYLGFDFVTKKVFYVAVGAGDVEMNVEERQS